MCSRIVYFLVCFSYRVLYHFGEGIGKMLVVKENDILFESEFEFALLLFLSLDV